MLTNHTKYKGYKHQNSDIQQKRIKEQNKAQYFIEAIKQLLLTHTVEKLDSWSHPVYQKNKKEQRDFILPVEDKKSESQVGVWAELKTSPERIRDFFPLFWPLLVLELC